MCYDIKASLEAQLSRARRRGDLMAIAEIEEKLVPYTDLPLHHASGFSHPELLIYTDSSPEFPEVATWGLVPHWVRDEEQLKKLWNNTLNARGETIFKKPSFRDAAKHQRCIIYIDGFYEHHHFNNKTYPFYIHKKDNEPIALAGLWSKWINPETGGHIKTFTIVTTEGNMMMSKIHNNPKIKGPRMPLILHKNLEDKWLDSIENQSDIKTLQGLIRAYPEDELQAHTVRKLRGKDYMGNVAEIAEPFNYNDLEF
ncbi:Putative SOS response-associated peptidase YedK [Formosa sp. Hel1_31_208]|uniref:SOS response-associated peptidase n=1 Tax=Formosa sp. Hel1_31_208 TaxID=1798225 RepID=UPI00087D2A1F|nr:SOS response-associated peptidase [Formosa sp. Hel1_31_208]SDS20951.1 Putative SOS response-associated peptidase YedK [Formosa sp. Hel1_31_208]